MPKDEPVFVYHVAEFESYGPGQDYGLFSTWAKAADYLWDLETMVHNYEAKGRIRGPKTLTDDAMEHFRYNVNADNGDGYPHGVWIYRRQVR